MNMFRLTAFIGLLVALAACMGASQPHGSDLRVYHIAGKNHTNLTELVPVLKQQRIVIVGEHHTNKAHHQIQLSVIQALRKAGVEVVIGLEMFRSDSQQQLNRWTAGELDEPDFKNLYFDNWGFEYDVYRMIFEYARKESVPLIGLNVSREITSQVARKGFDSLSKAQRGKLSNVTCRVDDAYMDYIRKAFGAHGHGKMDFTYFCEAQLVWDTIMAVNAIDFLKANPGTVMVLLCGAGHAQKGAIPRQIRSRSDLAHLVMLPEAPQSITIDAITDEDADYVIRLEN